MHVKYRILSHGEGLELPSLQTVGAAGYDLVSAVSGTLQPGLRALIPLGFEMEIPEGFEAQIRPRSSLALKYGVTVLNSPGTIDSDFRGEVHVLLINHGLMDFDFKRGERIAQMVFSKVSFITSAETSVTLSPSERSSGGFGSTGI